MTDELTATGNARDIAVEYGAGVPRQRDALLKALWSLYWNVTDEQGKRYLPDQLLLRDVWAVLRDVDPEHAGDQPVSNKAYRWLGGTSGTNPPPPPPPDRG